MSNRAKVIANSINKITATMWVAKSTGFVPWAWTNCSRAAASSALPRVGDVFRQALRGGYLDPNIEFDIPRTRYPRPERPRESGPQWQGPEEAIRGFLNELRRIFR